MIAGEATPWNHYDWLRCAAIRAVTGIEGEDAEDGFWYQGDLDCEWYEGIDGDAAAEIRDALTKAPAFNENYRELLAAAQTVSAWLIAPDTSEEVCRAMGHLLRAVVVKIEAAS